MGKFTLLTSITLDAAGFKTGTEQVNNQVKTLKDGIKSANSAAGASFTDLATKVTEPTRNLQELTRAYRELKNTSFAGKTPEEIADIKAKMAGLIDEIGDYKAELNQMSLDPFQKFASGAAGISSMMGGVTAGLGLLGVKSDGLNVAMQKTVLLMGLSNGLQQAAVFFQENALGIEMKLGLAKITNLIRTNALKNIEIIQQKAATAATIEGAGATGILSSAMISLNAIVAANPVGALVVGLVALGAVVAVVAVALSDSGDVIDNTSQKLANYNFYVNNLSRDIERLATISKAQGKTELELIDEKLAGIKQLDAANQAQIDILLKKKELNDDEAAKLSELTKKQSELTDALNNTTTARIAQTIIDEKAATDRRKIAVEFKNTLIREQLTGKAKELADLEDWKNKSIAKYREYSDVVATILKISNAKEIAIETKYYKEREKAQNDAIKNMFAGRSLVAAKKELNNTIATTLEDVPPVVLKVNIAPIATTELITLQEKIGLAGSAMNGLSDAFITMAETGKLSVKDLVMSTLAGIRQIVVAKLAEAMMSQTASNSKYGLPGLAMAAIGITGVMAIFAKLPKFESGGIVGGNSYSGDKITARLNSGEMVLNTRQQGNLFDMLNQGITDGLNKVEFIIRGDTLVGITNKMNKVNGFR